LVARAGFRGSTGERRVRFGYGCPSSPLDTIRRRKELRMTDVILFNHALGMTDGVRAFADRLRDAGHAVTLGDLFEGRTFDTIDAGVAYEEELGWEEVLARAKAAIAPLPPAVVIGGFSLGAFYAQALVQTREGALGALLYHAGDNPPSVFETPWPTQAALQVHVSEDDPWYDRDGGGQLIAETGGELFLYPGSAHLFTDSSWQEYDEVSTDLVVERTLAFLDRLSPSGTGRGA
jgi:dienelactone hydrolase